ncbi:MAG: hypothetical protein J3K34DRAFT_128674 [Monoraphidium minutum]|nr:MAG: hypothetical protein J3K34DRAFT_128674 [Monoraphidium minutum]
MGPQPAQLSPAGAGVGVKTKGCWAPRRLLRGAWLRRLRMCARGADPARSGARPRPAHPPLAPSACPTPTPRGLCASSAKHAATLRPLRCDKFRSCGGARRPAHLAFRRVSTGWVGHLKRSGKHTPICRRLPHRALPRAGPGRCLLAARATFAAMHCFFRPLRRPRCCAKARTPHTVPRRTRLKKNRWYLYREIYYFESRWYAPGIKTTKKYR